MTEPVDEYLQRVRDDPGLRAVLRTARAWGVSPRRFLGWEPTRTSRELADGTTIETVEPEWDDEARNMVMALEAWEADLCPACRQPMSQTTNPENEGRYRAGLAIRCHYCTAQQIGSEVYAESPQPQALLLPIELRPTVPAQPA